MKLCCRAICGTPGDGPGVSREIKVNLLKNIRLEIDVNEDFVEETIDAICQGVRTGQIGDGKIVVLDLQQCIRIRTGETGGAAIG